MGQLIAGINAMGGWFVGFGWAMLVQSALLMGALEPMVKGQEGPDGPGAQRYKKAEDENADINVSVRGLVCAYEQMSAILDVEGELFAGPINTEFVLRPFDQTCLISRIDAMFRNVVLEYSGKDISLPFASEPTSSWKMPYNGLSASLEPVNPKYEYGSKVMVRFTLHNTSDRDMVLDLGHKHRPHFGFFITYERLGAPLEPPKHITSRKSDFRAYRRPVRPYTLGPGEKTVLEFDLNKFIHHAVGTPEAMGSLPIGQAPAWYDVVGIYQQLGTMPESVWSGGVTTNRISFRVLHKEEVVREFYRIDREGIHWNYAALAKAANSTDRKHLDLMVHAKAVHLVPQIIDKIRPGGFTGVEKCLRTIIGLTGHDFSQDFDIKRIWQPAHAAKIKLLLRQWWQDHGEEAVRERGAVKEWRIPRHWEEESAKMTPLHWAVVNGDIKNVQEILMQGADVRAKAEEDWTALHWAAFMGHTDIAKVLYAHGADLGATDQFNATSLECAELMEHIELAKLLRRWSGELNDGSKKYFVGDFKMGRSDASVCLETKDGAVWSLVITFLYDQEDLQAVLKVVYKTDRPFTWRTLVELLDVEGHVIARGDTVCQNDVGDDDTRRRASRDLRLSLGKWSQAAHAKRFRLVFEPAFQSESQDMPEQCETPVQSEATDG